jgi:hypothetical protein
LEKLRKELGYGLPDRSNVVMEYLNYLTDALALLKEQESEAKWIYGEDETGVDGWRCSECGFFEPWFYEFTDDIDFIRFYGHCPSCGRKMTSYTGKPTQGRR